MTINILNMYDNIYKIFSDIFLVHFLYILDRQCIV